MRIAATSPASSPSARRERVRAGGFELDLLEHPGRGLADSGSGGRGGSGSIPNDSSTSATAVSGDAPLRSSRFEPVDSVM